MRKRDEVRHNTTAASTKKRHDPAIPSTAVRPARLNNWGSSRSRGKSLAGKPGYLGGRGKRPGPQNNCAVGKRNSPFLTKNFSLPAASSRRSSIFATPEPGRLRYGAVEAFTCDIRKRARKFEPNSEDHRVFLRAGIFTEGPTPHKRSAPRLPRFRTCLIQTGAKLRRRGLRADF